MSIKTAVVILALTCMPACVRAVPAKQVSPTKCDGRHTSTVDAFRSAMATRGGWASEAVWSLSSMTRRSPRSPLLAIEWIKAGDTTQRTFVARFYDMMMSQLTPPQVALLLRDESVPSKYRARLALGVTNFYDGDVRSFFEDDLTPEEEIASGLEFLLKPEVVGADSLKQLEERARWTHGRWTRAGQVSLKRAVEDDIIDHHEIPLVWIEASIEREASKLVPVAYQWIASLDVTEDLDVSVFLVLIEFIRLTEGPCTGPPDAHLFAEHDVGQLRQWQKDLRTEWAELSDLPREHRPPARLRRQGHRFDDSMSSEALYETLLAVLRTGSDSEVVAVCQMLRSIFPDSDMIVMPRQSVSRDEGSDDRVGIADLWAWTRSRAITQLLHAKLFEMKELGWDSDRELLIAK